MKLKYLSILFLSVFALAACAPIKQNYALQYSFSNIATTETKVEATNNGVKIEFPFADFSCDAASFIGELGRLNNTFVITLSGNETADRCAQKFNAEITGVEPGEYSIQLVYRRDSGENQVLFDSFTVSN